MNAKPQSQKSRRLTRITLVTLAARLHRLLADNLEGDLAAIALIGAGLMAASLSVQSARSADLPPAQSFVLERTAGDVVFSADLQWLAVNQTDSSVAAWDVTKGIRAGSWSGNGSLAFLSHSNELLVAEGTNLTVRELLTGPVLRRMEPPTNGINSLTIAASGKVAAATVGSQRQLIFWNLEAGKIIRQLPTGRYPWESSMRGGPMPRMLPISMSAGLCQAFSPGGTRFAVGQTSAQVDVWNLTGSNYSRYLGTVSGPGQYGMSTSGRADALIFLDNQRLAVVYNREQLAVLTLNTNDAEVLQGLPRMSFTAKTPDGEQVSGEVVAQQKSQASMQIQRLGLTPVTLEILTEGKRNYSYQFTNTIGWPVVGQLTATNRADAAAQFEKRGLRHGRIIEAPDDIVAVQSRERALQEILKQHPDWSLLQKQQTLIGNPGFEIRSLAVSGDGRRLAVAGMRMAWRKGVFAPAGDGVYDAPLHAELKVWDAVEMKLLVTIQGRSDEKFARVALNETGGRVAAVTTGVTYNSRMSRTEQQGQELAPASPRRVYVWELPSDKPEPK